MTPIHGRSIPEEEKPIRTTATVLMSPIIRLILLPLVLLLCSQGVFIGAVGASSDDVSHHARALTGCIIGKYSADGQNCQSVDAGYYPSVTAAISIPASPSGYWFGVTASPDFRQIAATLSGGNVYLSSDSGATWAATGLGGRAWRGIASTPDFTKLAVTLYTGNIYFSVDGKGANWLAQTSAGTRSWTDIACSPDFSTFVAAASTYTSSSGGNLYASYDAGATWSALLGAGSRDWTGVTASPDFVKMAACVGFGGGYIYMSSDKGLTWTAMTDAGSRQWQGITSTADFTKLAATAYEDYIYIYMDSGNGNGATWTSVTEAGSHFWGGIAASPDFSKFIAVTNMGGFFYQSGDGGKTWAASGGAVSGVVAATGGATAQNKCPPGMYSHANAASCTLCPAGSYATDSGSSTCTSCPVGKYSAGVGVALCDQVAAGYYPSVTATITTPASASGTWFGVTASPDFRQIAATLSGGNVYLSSDSGVTWTGMTGGGAGNAAWYGIASTPDFTKLAATVYNGDIFLSFNKGISWSGSAMAGTRSWTGIACSPDFSMFAAAALGNGAGDSIYVSINGGVTWPPLAQSGAMNWGGVTASPDFTKMAAFEISGNIYTFVSSGNGLSWIRTIMTSAGARSWTGITSTADFTKLAATDNNYIYVCVDSGNGNAATWSIVTAAGSHFWAGIAAAPDFSMFIAVTKSGGTIYQYQSGDKGTTWTSMANGAASVVVAATGGATAQNKCPPGMYSLGGFASCTLCPAGSYATDSGSSTCTLCSAGKYSTGVGVAADLCLVCSPNMQSSFGASVCHLEPTGLPTMQPSGQPTGQPSGQPSSQPSVQPSGQPTVQPSMQPTGQPTSNPTRLAGKMDAPLAIGLANTGGAYSGDTTFTNLGSTASVYLSLSLYQAGWGNDGTKFVTFSAWNQKLNNWVVLVPSCSPEALPSSACAVNKNPFSSCAFNIDVTQYVFSTQGGSLVIRTDASPAVGETLPNCMWAGKYPVYAKMVVSTAHGQPTPSPTNLPPTDAITATNSLLLDSSMHTAYEVAAGLVVLLGAAVGVYYAILRDKSKAVALAALNAGLLTSFSGAEVVISICLIASILKAGNNGWAMVLVLIRLVQIVVASVILFTIYGPEGARACTNFSKLFDSDHMASNAKMYKFASVLSLPDVNLFVLLPWRDSEFARRSSGMPNMALFKTVLFTTGFTGAASIATQALYLRGRPFAATNYFFYANMSIQAVKVASALFEYCILTSTLHSCTTADMSPSDQIPGNSKDAKTARVDGIPAKIADAVPNPMQSSGNARTNSRAAAAVAAYKDDIEL